MSVEQNTLGFEDQDDVLWVRTVHNTGRFGAQELVGLVDLLKHVLNTHRETVRVNHSFALNETH